MEDLLNCWLSSTENEIWVQKGWGGDGADAKVKGWIGQDAVSGPEQSITLLAAVGWFGGPIFLDPFRVSFLSDEVVRGHRVCWVQPSWHRGVCFVFLHVDVKLSRPDALL